MLARQLADTPREDTDPVARYAAAKSRADVESALACCTDDFFLETVPFGLRAAGADVEWQLRAFFAAFPDYRVTVDGRVDGPDTAVAWGTAHATLTGAFGAIAPTGRAFALPFVSIFPLRDGRLAGERFFFDLAAMCQQLGLETAVVDAQLRAFRGDAAVPSPGEDFVARFVDFWRPPVDLRRLPMLVHDDVRLVTAGQPDTVGVDAAIESFGRVFAVVPDFRVELVRWSASAEHAFLELRLTGTLAGQRLDIPAVDRMLLRDGRIVERVSFFDPTSFQQALASLQG